MGRNAKKTLFQREIQETNWQIKKILNIIDYLKSTNQNTEISSHIYQNDNSSKIQQINIGEEVKKRNTCAVCKNVNWISHDENSMEVFKKVKNRTTL